MEDKKFCIYIHNNKINNKKYIGQTSNPQQRWFPANYKGCTKFYNAIKKYGWENFQHIILIDNLTLEEANQKEQQLIKQYNTIENGYNLKTGGLNNLYSKQSRQKMSNSNNAKPIICIETKKVYKNAMEVQRQLGFKETNIISCCQHHLHTAYNFHWEYYDSSFNYDNYKPMTKDKRKRAVFCKELKRVFSSAAEASRELNISQPNISKCCSKKDSLKTAGGYHWQYYQEET